MAKRSVNVETPADVVSEEEESLTGNRRWYIFSKSAVGNSSFAKKNRGNMFSRKCCAVFWQLKAAARLVNSGYLNPRTKFLLVILLSSPTRSYHLKLLLRHDAGRQRRCLDKYRG